MISTRKLATLLLALGLSFYSLGCGDGGTTVPDEQKNEDPMDVIDDESEAESLGEESDG